MYLLNGCWFINAPVTSRQPHTLVKHRQEEGIKYPLSNGPYIKERRLESKTAYIKAIY